MKRLLVNILIRDKVPRPCGKDLLKAAATRGMAFFLGCFSLLNVLGEFFSPGFDANLWWIDLRLLPAAAAQVFLLLVGLCLLNFALRSALPGRQRRVSMWVLGLALLVTVGNVLQYYFLWAQGRFHTSFPVPLSLLLSFFLGIILRRLFKPVAPEPHPLARHVFAITCLASLILFSLAQFFCFGKTDYRRPADVIVVFGARTFADGRPSDALADRVRTGCQLYHQGLARKLVFSGGPGDGPIHETEAMRQLALKLGVRKEDIFLDGAGRNTQATIRNTAKAFRQARVRRVLVVSHFYHLPRIKMGYQREGLEVYTVPAKESYLLRKMPWFLARELPAFWFYYFRALWA